MLNTCEAFSITPSEAWLEIFERNPDGWIRVILELRAYRNAWRYLQNHPPTMGDELTDMQERVNDNEAELAMAVLDRRRGGD